MSSPLAKTKKTLFDQLLVGLHQRMSHGHRIETLAKQISCFASSYVRDAEKFLDIGCGDLSLAQNLQKQLKTGQWVGVDIHEKPVGSVDKWLNYYQFDGRILPFNDREFDFALLSDVLHHVSPEDQLVLLKESIRVSSVLVVKDHFEYGAFSRSVLKVMDFIGNFGYGVRVPQAYLTEKSFNNLVTFCDAEILRSQVGLQLYDHLPGFRYVLNPDWQFLAIVRRR